MKIGLSVCDCVCALVLVCVCICECMCTNVRVYLCVFLCICVYVGMCMHVYVPFMLLRQEKQVRTTNEHRRGLSGSGPVWLGIGLPSVGILLHICIIYSYSKRSKQGKPHHPHAPNPPQTLFMKHCFVTIAKCSHVVVQPNCSSSSLYWWNKKPTLQFFNLNRQSHFPCRSGAL